MRIIAIAIFIIHIFILKERMRKTNILKLYKFLAFQIYVIGGLFFLSINKRCLSENSESNYLKSLKLSASSGFISYYKLLVSSSILFNFIEPFPLN